MITFAPTEWQTNHLHTAIHLTHIYQILSINLLETFECMQFRTLQQINRVNRMKTKVELLFAIFSSSEINGRKIYGFSVCSNILIVDSKNKLVRAKFE